MQPSNSRTARWAFLLAAFLLLISKQAGAQLPAVGLSGDAMARAVKARTDARAEVQRTLSRQDAVTVVLVGTGSPLPSPRAQACTAVFANGQFLLFDCGDGASRSIDELNLPIGAVDAVFLTHYHSDHFADLGEIIDRSWIQGRRRRLAVHGPTGVVGIVDGFERAYRLEAGYRTAHHGHELMPPEHAAAEAKAFVAPTGGEPVVVYDHAGVKVKAFAVNHPPVHPAVGYRIEYGGKVVVISGDTTATRSLQAQSQDADLLCAEAMNMALVEQMENANRQLGHQAVAQIMHDIRSYHMDVHELGELAQQAKVKRLALTHLVPPLPNAVLALAFKNPVAEKFRGEIIVGDDGTRIVLPLK